MVATCTSSSRSPKFVVALPAPRPMAETSGPFLPSLRYFMRSKSPRSLRERPPLTRGSTSVCLDPRGLDHRRPARELGLHPLAQLLGRGRRCRHALLEKGFLGFGRAQDVADLAVELRDDRARLETASALTLPAFNWPCAVRGDRNEACTSPASTAVSAKPALLYGMCWSGTPVTFFRSSPARWLVEPLPADE